MNFKITADRAAGILQRSDNVKTDDRKDVYRQLDLFNRHNYFRIGIGFPTEDYKSIRLWDHSNTEYSISLAMEDDTDFIMATIVAHDEDEGKHDDVKFSMRFAWEDLIQFFIDNPKIKDEFEWKMQARMRS